MLEEKPLQMQFNEKKEIEELSTSYNDTQARSQSLKPKIILDPSNSQEFIVNLVALVIIETRIEELESEIEELKQANTKFLEDTEKKKNLKCLQKFLKLQINTDSTKNRKKNLLTMLLRWQMNSARKINRRNLYESFRILRK